MFSRIVVVILPNKNCVLLSWNSFPFREEHLLPDLFHLGLTAAAFHFRAYVKFLLQVFNSVVSHLFFFFSNLV